MAIVAISITPTGVGPSVGEYVTAALRVLEDQTDVRWELGAMFTTLEGDLETIFPLVRRMQEAVFAKGALRVGTVIKIDDRRDAPSSMADKVASVRRALGRS